MDNEMPEPKFKVGQIVMVSSIRKSIPFKVVAAFYQFGEWYYKLNRRTAFAEHMLRPLTHEEAGAQ